VRLLGRVLLAFALALLVAFAIVNSQRVDLDLWAWTVTLPLYLLIIATLIVGVVIGGIMGWLGGAPRRRRSRERARRSEALEERIATIERDRPASPATSRALPSPRPPPHMDDE
jgi:uncharacterized integral membrane protein